MPETIYVFIMAVCPVVEPAGPIMQPLDKMGSWLGFNPEIGPLTVFQIMGRETERERERAIDR